VLPVISAFMSKGVPEGEPVVLDVAQLEALLSKTFGIGLDAGRGKEPVALVRLRLARALLGAAEASAVAAERSPPNAAPLPPTSRRPKVSHCTRPHSTACPTRSSTWRAGR
jgi:hypothetical protein